MNEHNFNELPDDVKKIYFRYAKLKSYLNDILDTTSNELLDDMNAQFNNLMEHAKKMGNSPFIKNFMESTDKAYHKSVNEIKEKRKTDLKPVSLYKDALAAAVEDLGNKGYYVKGLSVEIKNISKDKVEDIVNFNAKNKSHFTVSNFREYPNINNTVIITFPVWYHIQDNAFDIIRKIKEQFPESTITGSSEINFEEILKHSSLSSARSAKMLNLRDYIFKENPAIIPYVNASDAEYMMANGDVYSEKEIEKTILEEIIKEYSPKFEKEYNDWEKLALSHIDNYNNSSFTM